MARLLSALLLSLLAGCVYVDNAPDPPASTDAGETQPPVQPRPQPTQPPPQQVQPQRHDWARGRPIVVPAGAVYAYEFRVTGQITVGYEVVRQDESSFDVGFIADEDLEAFRQGHSVRAWASNSNMASASGDTTLSAGTYDFVVRCRNEFADCDLSHNLWAIY